MSVGRQMAGTRFSGSGLLGRQLSSLGIDFIKSSADSGVMTFSVPIGPATIDYRPGSAIDWHINVLETVSAIQIAASSARFDLRKSLFTDAPVFHDRDGNYGYAGDFDIHGKEQLGSIRLAANAEATDPAILYHESIHIIQSDYVDEIIALPIERLLVRKIPGGKRFLQHFDVGWVGPFLETQVRRRIRYSKRPEEQEAYGLTSNGSE